VFVNGRYEATHSDLSGLPPTVKLLTLAEVLADPDSRASNFMQRRYARVDEVFARLNSALAQDGAVLRMAEDTRLAQPLHLVFIGTASGDADAASHARNLIELRRGAEATVVEHHLGSGDHANLGNVMVHVHLAAG